MLITFYLIGFVQGSIEHFKYFVDLIQFEDSLIKYSEFPNTGRVQYSTSQNVSDHQMVW